MHLPPWMQDPIAGLSLDAAGLVALADLQTISTRTVLLGNATYLDMFVLCPGIHMQQKATGLNGSELPPCADLTTGHVFRIENPATVVFIQRVGTTGHLTTINVIPGKYRSKVRRIIDSWWAPGLSSLASLLYISTILVTLCGTSLVVFIQDRWALCVILVLMIARLLNIVVVRRRSSEGWKGAREGSAQGEFLVLLSQDRWIKLKGPVDDVKVAGAGQWLRDMTFLEESMASIATLLVYLDAAIASNATQSGKIVLICMLLLSAGLLALSNNQLKTSQMFGRTLKMTGIPKAYERRLFMAEDLIKESRRDDWAIRLGVIHKAGNSKSADILSLAV